MSASELNVASSLTAGVAAAPLDHAPSWTVLTARTRTVYSVAFVKPVIVWLKAGGSSVTAWRLPASQSSLPDFHCT